MYFKATFLAVWDFPGNTPTFCRCSITVTSDGFSPSMGPPLGGQRSSLVQKASAVAASVIHHIRAFSFMLYV